MRISSSPPPPTASPPPPSCSPTSSSSPTPSRRLSSPALSSSPRPTSGKNHPFTLKCIAYNIAYFSFESHPRSRQLLSNLPLTLTLSLSQSRGHPSPSPPAPRPGRCSRSSGAASASRESVAEGCQRRRRQGSPVVHTIHCIKSCVIEVNKDEELLK